MAEILQVSEEILRTLSWRLCQSNRTIQMRVLTEVDWSCWQGQVKTLSGVVKFYPGDSLERTPEGSYKVHSVQQVRKKFGRIGNVDYDGYAQYREYLWTVQMERFFVIKGSGVIWPPGDYLLEERH